METKTGNTWVPFCMRCNHVRKGDKDKCHVCSYSLETICLGCGTSPDQGEHECKVITIPANPLAVQKTQLRAEVEELKQQRQGQGLLNVKLMRELKAAELQYGDLTDKVSALAYQIIDSVTGVQKEHVGAIISLCDKDLQKHNTNELRLSREDIKKLKSLPGKGPSAPVPEDEDL